jgi:glucose-1-phosphatase
MIETIIFDFGNIFIDLNKNATLEAFKKLGLNEWSADLDLLNQKYELGKINELEFIKGIQARIPNADILDIRQAWNEQIGDFPLNRLEFLQLIKSEFRLLLLSNADNTHIERFEHMVGLSFSRDFYSSFEKTYFSFDISLRKPDVNVFKFILNNHNISPKTTLFIDDTFEHIESAKSLGINTWHLNPEKENVTELFKILKTIHD